ncbi:hypothetical protein CAPNMURICA_79 [Arthrobacter phage CapnMurica]|uniref:Uncharacterized protein n=1 Tax=Arthrobacter phage CapnMurica TaxID=1772294 RepID=A0A0U4ITL1_9CAUD|nr:hypothetical protein FDH68_gp79 [Arthrobacter phage CaptnMurica]ALY08679.1 hypothetical protein CAPNMURICA_79 [Arthrobacter phage CaptnMurica]
MKKYIIIQHLDGTTEISTVAGIPVAEMGSQLVEPNQSLIFQKTSR